MKKLMFILIASAFNASAMAGTWSLDWSEQGKYYDASEKSDSYYLTSRLDAKNMYYDYIKKANIPADRNACVSVYTHSGFLAGPSAKGYYINLSKIAKVTSQGGKTVSGENVRVERFILKDGTSIDTVGLNGNGTIYSCALDANGKMTTKPLPWSGFNIIHDGPRCKFNEDKSKDQNADQRSVFNALPGDERSFSLGFNFQGYGYSEVLNQSQAEGMSAYQECQDGQQKLAEFSRFKDKSKQEIIDEYKRIHGDPVAKVMANLNALLNKSKSKQQATPLQLTLGETSQSTVKEKIGSKTPLQNPEVAEINGKLGCMQSQLFDTTNALVTTDYKLDSIGADSISKVLFCFNKKDKLHRLDMSLSPYAPSAKAVYDDLAKKYTMVTKSMSKGRTQEDISRDLVASTSKQYVIPPYVNYALFVQGNTVIKYVFNDAEYSSYLDYRPDIFHTDITNYVLERERSSVTYMTKQLYVDIIKYMAEDQLRSDAMKWNLERKRITRTSPY